MLSVISSLRQLNPVFNPPAAIQWTDTNISVPLIRWTESAYGNGYYVLSKYSNTTLAWSADTINWTTLNTGNGTTVSYGNNIFLAWTLGAFTLLRFDTTAASPTWTSVTVSSQMGEWFGIAYGNGRWMAASRRSNLISTSVDNGLTWTSRAIELSTGGLAKLEFKNGKFIMWAAQIIVSSDNGASWTAIPNPTTSLTHTSPIISVHATPTAILLLSDDLVASIHYYNVSNAIVNPNLYPRVYPEFAYGNGKAIIIGGSAEPPVTATTYVVDLNAKTITEHILSQAFPFTNVIYDEPNARFISILETANGTSTIMELPE